MSITNSSKSEMREKTFRICRDYLNGVWKMISPHDMVLKQVSGGLSNFLYYCALPPSMAKPKQGEPSKVLVRFYGQVHGEGALEALLTESVIFTLLSERKLGPKLHGIFPGGRLEEFIPARPLRTKELAEPDISALIAEKMAQVHSLDVPISKEPSWIWDTMTRWMNNAKTQSPRSFLDENDDVDDVKLGIKSVRSMLQWQLDTEIVWLRSYLAQLRSPVVFCHNDLQEGNILVRESAQTPEERLVIIDFEYCSYNYRGFDIANHFCEWMYDYTLDKYPKFTYNPAGMPTVDQKLLFIRCYLETMQREMGMDELVIRPSSSGRVVIGPKNEARLLREADCFVLASHFFWGLWAIVNAPVSLIPFGYRDYAEARFAAYFEHKEYLLSKYGDVIDAELD